MSSRYQLRPEAIPLLLKLVNPISKDEALRLVALETGSDNPHLSCVFDAIQSSGILQQEDDESAQSSSYAFGYGRGLLAHKPMLMDYARTHAFRKAIEEVVRPGDVVIDVGAGSGILGCFAAAAGAKRVILIENTPVIEDARKIVKANGLEEKIEFYRGDAKSFDMDIVANVIVSEWIGLFLMEEYMYSAFTRVRDRCLKAGGVSVPRRARLYLAPIDDSELYFQEGPGFWEAPVYGFDFSIGKDRQLSHLRKVYADVKRESVIAEPWQVLSIDCHSDFVDAFHFEKTGEFVIERGGSIHGFCGFFDLDLSSHVALDTSPFAQTTHWKQAYFPMPQFAVEKGDRIQIHMRTSPGGVGPDISLKAMVFRGTVQAHSLEYTYLGQQF
jgi:PRMT5 arginine-N-methyltransferase/ribosomal protein L11 methyltransferase PrmA